MLPILGSTPRPRVLAATLCAAALSVTLAGCGGGDDDNGKASATSSARSSQSAVADAGGPTANPTGIVSAPGDIDRTTKPSTTAAAVPKDGPTGIGTFPLPPGVKVKGPGPTDKSWQFDILTKDVDGVLAFYRKALAADGYQVKNNVTENQGAEIVKYDIEFSGKATGFIVGTQSQNDVFVVVQSPPEDQPSAQPGVRGGNG